MAIQVKNQSKRLINEIWELKKKNRPLLELLLDVRDYVSQKYNKHVVITQIFRTEEEQDTIYSGMKRGDREYDKDPWVSPHQLYGAIDLRSRTYTEEEIEDIVDYINDKYDPINVYKFTAMCHEVGNHGMHFHIQFAKKPD